MALNFVMTGNNKGLMSSLLGAQNAVNDTTRAVERQGAVIDAVMKKMGKAVAGAFASFGIAELAKNVIETRKEFENLETSFSTLLGSAEKGKKLFADITKLATSTPLLEKDLAAAAQTMLGFNIEAEKIMPLLKQIGDVSMGDSQKMQSLALAFSQASSTGKLMGQDWLQMG